MSGLAEALVNLEHTLRLSGAVVASHFRSGREPSTTRRRLDQIGLVPSDEVVEWFRWHDGASDPNAGLRNSELAPGVYIFDLDTLCREYLDTRRDFATVAEGLPEPWSDSSDLWSPSWFPIARLDAGYIAVDLAGGRVSTSPVHAAWCDAGPEYKSHPQWPTVEAFVQALIGRYQDGTYEVGPDGHVSGPDVDADLRQRP